MLLASHTHTCHRADCRNRAISHDLEPILNPAAPEARPNLHVDLILESERTFVLRISGHARPVQIMTPRLRSGRAGDAEAGSAPERVFGLFHVSKVPTEMNDTGQISFGELNDAVIVEGTWRECDGRSTFGFFHGLTPSGSTSVLTL